MEQRSVEVLRLTAEETEALTPGVNLICKEAGNNFIIYKVCIPPRLVSSGRGGIDLVMLGLSCQDGTPPLTYSRLFCILQSVARWDLGVFAGCLSTWCMASLCVSSIFFESLKSEACNWWYLRTYLSPFCSVLRCTKHGWKLDPTTMKYVNPPDSFSQDKLVPELDEDGRLSLVELIPPEPWGTDVRPPQTILPGEVQLTFFAHACMELKLGDKTMFFDPWLTGPAFARGWWLIHEPPADWLERLSRADLIYISHVHSDHLSYPTLTLLSEKNPNIPIYVGDTAMPVFCKLEQSGVQLKNINVCSFGVWQEVNADLRFMILMDGVHPDMDTCILVDYKGHLILNTVDCTQPNGGRLPQNVDIMMSDFAGGASGFPMTFSGGRYTDEWKAAFISTERKKLLYYKTQVVRDVNPKVYCPFAGYFVEAYPSDTYIRDTNTKNSAERLNALINRYSDHIITWTPRPGATLDLARVLDDTVDRRLTKRVATVFDMVLYSGVTNMIETDEDFQPVEGGYDFLVDFSDLSFPAQRPAREHAYLEIKNRIGVHRQTVLKGLFWDDLYIGFQNRISRDPDTFHYKFWNHMQILLPEQPPDWTGFLCKQRKMHDGKYARAVWKPSDKSNSVVSSLLDMLVRAKLLLVPGVMASMATAVYLLLTFKR
ncbi:cytidine monophosphate-N-acetylneuraminic acid hydroxylase-like [Branchiostoma floridae]|uniref:Cytidine monophosphate-N-acetylneuraminic acid hydroxylase-like n=1 Tax=Branchiostoma floridae TaxID=7739 RepID=A0A9J7LH44_BRAFL|nr:cytidine monophosphate-N-acetylneuraminic acid hydroxylase-like [Branchiostoma floridae]